MVADRLCFDLSVVIPAHNAAATLVEQLDAVLDQEWTGTWEVIVVDNRSTDNTRAIVESYAARDPRVRVVLATERQGIGYTRNQGIIAACGRGIAMCDSDDVVAEGWIEAIGTALETHDFVTGPLDVQSLNEPWLVATRGLAIEKASGNFLGVFDFAHSCNVAFRRSMIDTTSGFDETLVNGSDVEFSFRAWRAGYILHYVEDAVVAYRYRTTMDGLWRQARNYSKVRPVLIARVQSTGVAVSPPTSWRGWLWLVRSLPQLRDRAGRARWVWTAGLRVGAIEGHPTVRRVLRSVRRRAA